MSKRNVSVLRPCCPESRGLATAWSWGAETTRGWPRPRESSAGSTTTRLPTSSGRWWRRRPVPTLTLLPSGRSVSLLPASNWSSHQLPAPISRQSLKQNKQSILSCSCGKAGEQHTTHDQVAVTLLPTWCRPLFYIHFLIISTYNVLDKAQRGSSLLDVKAI